MTTEINLDVVMDVSKENSIFSFPEGSLPNKGTFAAASWCQEMNSREMARGEILKLLVNLVSERLMDHDIWLFVGNSAWQPNTRIVKFRGLWGGLKASGVEFMENSVAHERPQSENGKLKYFGAIPFTNADICAAVQTMSLERSTYFLILPNSTNVEKALSKGWETNVIFDSDLLEFIAKNGGVLIRGVGDFDDPETCFIALAEPQLISSLI